MLALSNHLLYYHVSKMWFLILHVIIEGGIYYDNFCTSTSFTE